MRPNRLARAGPSGWTVETRACPLGSYTQRQVRVHGLAKRRLCNTVEGCIGRAKACAAYRWAVTAARSRTATISNLARARRALVLRALFGGPKSCVLVNLFMICPRWLASSQPTTTKSLSDHGYLMACLSKTPPSLRRSPAGRSGGGGNRPASSERQVGRVGRRIALQRAKPSQPNTCLFVSRPLTVKKALDRVVAAWRRPRRVLAYNSPR